MTTPTFLTYVKLYTMYDTVAEARTGAIIQCPNDEVARRSFNDALTSKDNPVPPKDLNLIYIGTLDSLGNITDNTVSTVARGADIIAANTQPLELAK